MKKIGAEFTGSFPNLTLCPVTSQPEFAFIGRSNVGKSSLINMICAHDELALTSGKPGKTRMINYFHINKQWFLVDLPGYGYAIASKALRKEWEKMISHYLTQRENLFCTFVLIDSRIPPQSLDIDFINWGLFIGDDVTLDIDRNGARQQVRFRVEEVSAAGSQTL